MSVHIEVILDTHTHTHTPKKKNIYIIIIYTNFPTGLL